MWCCNGVVWCSVPNLSIYSRLKDAHLYIFSHAVLKLLDEQKSISSIQGELVPYLVQLQFSPQAQKWAAVSCATSQAKALSMSHSSLATPVSVLKPDQLVELKQQQLALQQQQAASATAAAVAAVSSVGGGAGGPPPAASSGAGVGAGSGSGSGSGAASNSLPATSPLLRQQNSALTSLASPPPAHGAVSLAALLSSNSAAQLLANANQPDSQQPTVLVPDHPVQCYAYLAPPQTYLMRVNTVPTYIQANFEVSAVRSVPRVEAIFVMIG